MGSLDWNQQEFNFQGSIHLYNYYMIATSVVLFIYIILGFILRKNLSHISIYNVWFFNLQVCNLRRTFTYFDAYFP